MNGFLGKTKKKKEFKDKMLAFSLLLNYQHTKSA